ncbi:MAG TPA: hypothetical protein VGC39_03565 [Candidatus Methylacidiphilales bacterium]
MQVDIVGPRLRKQVERLGQGSFRLQKADEAAIELTNFGGSPTSTATITNGAGVVDGQGNLLSTTNTTALIEADADEVINLGGYTTLTNFGTILGRGITPDSAKNNGFDNGSKTHINPDTGLPYQPEVSTNVYSNSIGVILQNEDVVNNYGTITGNGKGTDTIEEDNPGTVVSMVMKKPERPCWRRIPRARPRARGQRA